MPSDRKKEKKRGASRWLRGGLALFFLFLACLFAYIQAKSRIPQKTLSLPEAEEYHDQDEGEGCLYYYEFVIPLSSEELSGLSLEEGKRYPTGSRIMGLNSRGVEVVQERADKIKAFLDSEEGGRLSQARKKYLTDQALYLDMAAQEKALLTPMAGRFFQSLDGYEDLFTPFSLNALSADELAMALEKEPSSYAGLKIRDDKQVFLTVSLEKGQYTSYQLGKTYPIDFGQGLKGEGKLQKKMEGADGRLALIFSLGAADPALGGQRFYQLRIDKGSFPAFWIPQQALLEENGRYYAYVLNKNNKLVKLEAEVLSFDFEKKQWIVRAGQSSQDKKDKKGRLESYDRLLLDPRKVKEEGGSDDHSK